MRKFSRADAPGAENKFDKDVQPIFADQIGHRGGGYPASELLTWHDVA